MARTNTFWQKLDNLWMFEKGLARIPRRYYLDLIEQYKPKNFLDAGCGLGTTYRVFLKTRLNRTIKYTGIDITEQFIRRCKKQFPNADFRKGTINNMPFEDNSYDMVACRAVLEHLKSPYKAIAEMARVAKDVVVITWFKQPRIKEKLHYRHIIGVWENVYSRDRILETTEENGLNLVDEFQFYYHYVWVLEKG